MKTLRNILDENNISLDRSVYYESGVLDYEMPLEGGFSVLKSNMEKRSYDKVITFLDLFEKGKKDESYRELLEQIEKLPRFEKEEKANLRRIKKEKDAAIWQDAFSKVFPSADAEQDVFKIAYKSGVSAIDLSELIDRRDVDNNSELDIFKHPWFLSDIDTLRSLSKTRKSGDIGIEGGSCMLGSDELLFHVMVDEKEHVFDFNTMQELTGKKDRNLSREVGSDLYEFIMENKERITSASIECCKDRITIDEYQQLLYMFILAKYFDAKMVVTIPDMSYEKTFVETFGGLKKEVYEPLYDDFVHHVNNIADISIRWIEKLQKIYKVKELVIFHKRDKELMTLFEERRKEYLDTYAKKHLTSNRDGRMEAVKDYVCMPAMPYYLWKLEHVIEINRLEEYPSIEKCRRMHKGKMKLHSMLFPQMPSGNGKTSCFYARKEYKKYVEE